MATTNREQAATLQERGLKPVTMIEVYKASQPVKCSGKFTCQCGHSWEWSMEHPVENTREDKAKFEAGYLARVRDEINEHKVRCGH